jgi:GAF domain-containing protein
VADQAQGVSLNRSGGPPDIEEFERALGECVAIAARAMTGSPMVSIALREDDGLRTVACSHARAEALDELQSTAGQGPCIDVIDTEEPVTVADLGADPRWRRFAAETGLRSLHSEPLKSEGRLLGVLTIYSARDAGFSEGTWAAAHVTAGFVGVLFRTALDAARQREIAAQLKEALTTRAIIDQALGVLMGQRHCTSYEAFELLRQISQVRNVKLHQVAAAVVEQVSGEPPQRTRFEDPPPR